MRGGTDPAERREEELLSIVPRDERQPYDMRRILELVFDRGSRLRGRPPLRPAADHRAGAARRAAGRRPRLRPEGLRRRARRRRLGQAGALRRRLRPVPAAGRATSSTSRASWSAPPPRSAGTMRRGTRAFVAVYQASVPWVSVLVRKVYGIAGSAAGDASRLNLRYAWPSGNWGSLPIAGGLEAAYRRELEAAEDPEALRAEIEARLGAVTLAVPHRRALHRRGDHRSRATPGRCSATGPSARTSWSARSWPADRRRADFGPDGSRSTGGACPAALPDRPRRRCNRPGPAGCGAGGGRACGDADRERPPRRDSLRGLDPDLREPRRQPGRGCRAAGRAPSRSLSVRLLPRSRVDDERRRRVLRVPSLAGAEHPLSGQLRRAAFDQEPDRPGHRRRARSHPASVPAPGPGADHRPTRHPASLRWGGRRAVWYLSKGSRRASTRQGHSHANRLAGTHPSASQHPRARGPFSLRRLLQRGSHAALGRRVSHPRCRGQRFRWWAAMPFTRAGEGALRVTPGRDDIARARRYLAGRAGVTSFAVVGTEGRFYGAHVHRRFVSASVVKAMLLVAYLRLLEHRHRDLDARSRSLLRPMIHVSDNDAATEVWSRVGNPRLRRLARRAGMGDFSIHGTWPNAMISAGDQAGFFFEMNDLLPRRFRSYANRLLSHITGSQSWGIPAIARPRWKVYFKGGGGPPAAGSSSTRSATPAPSPPHRDRRDDRRRSVDGVRHRHHSRRHRQVARQRAS